MAASRRLVISNRNREQDLRRLFTEEPQWASVSYGVFMCLECSGKHRGLGVHISFVRSVTMDSWSEIQIKKMEAGEKWQRMNRVQKVLPPSQGGKYVGFGSSPASSQRNNNSQIRFLSVMSQGFGRLSLVAASAAQSAANVVQAGTKELTSKVREGGYDYKVNETVNVVTAKTTEIGHRTWGIMRGSWLWLHRRLRNTLKKAAGRLITGNEMKVIVMDIIMTLISKKIKDGIHHLLEYNHHQAGIIILTARVLGIIGIRKTLGRKIT
ncbi:hypothetical protein GH714_013142 [Hevea brasiliensis]|uniref:Arf-GAP domain-containing protein n=1 Tax=Hevea brasiliensis TaxID=3981 RepID=A0A6A6M1E3_HEVBR|nr:hypothetical protein GH714_013142 [Hevea brasiliensis]